MKEVKKSKILKRYERRERMNLISIILFMTIFIPPMFLFISWDNKNIPLTALSVIYSIIHFGLMIYGIGVGQNPLTYNEYLRVESFKQTKRNIKRNRKWLQ